MRLLNRTALALVLATATGGLALAQTTAPANPLRPAGSRAATPAAPATTAPATTSAATTAAPKAKRARSEAQLANDNRMRECGKEWRGKKAALTKQGKTWRTFMPECNARLKAAGG
jgi:hypothetical protein